MEIKNEILGLSDSEVLERVNEGLVNISKNTNRRSNKDIIKDNLFTLFNFYNLLIAIALTMVGAYSNLSFIFIVALNVIIGIYQEIHARNLVDELSLLTIAKAEVLRNGKKVEINVEEIVKDDIIDLKMGSQICSDSIVMEGSIEVNESLLTGESDSIIKNKGDKLFSGSYVVSGHCYSKVLKVGDDNFASFLANEGKKHKAVNSELLLSMRKVTKFTSFIIIPVGILLFAEAFLGRNNTLENSVISTSAALLGMLPKGLMLLITLSLAAGVVKLSKKKVLVQDLYSVETLAHVDVLCLDKTGTITEGKMKVTNFQVVEEKIEDINLREFLNSFVNEMGDNNGTFLALKSYFKGDSKLKVSNKIAFSSERKWSAMVFEEKGTVVIGAPEKIIEKSNFIMPKEQIEAQKNGKRILLIAHSKEVIDRKLSNLEVVGILELSDPLRKNAKEILKFFKNEGVDVKVISGDNPLTVAKVAKEAGLESYKKYIDLSTIKDDSEIESLVDEYSIFARVSPNQKSLIVKGLQKKGHTVAMTGDGVNDVIALREADCSITVSEASEVVKQISQFVLLNSDFSVLKDVLMEGRRVVNNITNVARIFFIKTLYSIMLATLNISTFTAFPFIPIQITLIDMVIEGYTSFFISFDPNDDKVEGTFLNSVLKNAFPYALAIIVNSVILYFLAPTLNISKDAMGTILYYVVGFTSILGVIRACRPFNKKRIFLATTAAIGFFMATILEREKLELAFLGILEVKLFIVMAFISIIIIVIKNLIFEKIKVI